MKRVVGTAEDCDLRVTDAPYMSSHHFSIRQASDGSVSVEDEGSTNGTEVFTPFAGWARVYRATAIGPGSKILAGRVLFKVGSGGYVDVVKDVSILERDRA